MFVIAIVLVVVIANYFSREAQQSEARRDAIQLKALANEAEREGQELLRVVESIRILKDYPWKEEVEKRLKKESEDMQEILQTWMYKTTTKSRDPFVVTLPRQDRCNKS